MNKLTSLLCSSALLMMGFVGNAQELTTSVYFNSGRHSLDKEAIATLEKFVNEAKEVADFDLDIKAFTDDVGSIHYNEKLADRRAQSINDFLEGFDLEPTSTEITGVGEIQLQNQVNAAVERRGNRRVDIVITPFQPKSLKDLYSYFFDRGQQTYAIRTDRDTTIFGAQGTRLFIPAGSFQYKDGSGVAAGEVVITLREALTYEDMLFSNLTTRSGHEMLETGGMVHLDAKTKTGAQLEIKAGQELTLSLPSSDPLNEDMQLFYADRPVDGIAENIDWKATGTPFVSNNFETEKFEMGLSAINFEKLSRIEAPNIPAWPKAVTLPSKPYKPSQPRLRNNIAPTMETIMAKNPRRSMESEKKYEERIAGTYKNALATHNRLEAMNESAVKRYEVQLASYEQALVEYDQALKNANAYNQNLTDVRAELFANRTAIADWGKSFNWASSGFMVKVAKVFKASTQLEDYRAYLIEECKRFGLDTDLALIENMDFQEDTEFLQEMARKFGRCARTNQSYCANHHIATTANRANNLLRGNPEQLKFLGMSKRDQSMEKLYAAVDQLLGYKDFFNTLIDNYNEVLDASGFAANAEKLDALCDQLSEVHQKVLDIKIEKGLISPKAQEKIFMNTVGITQMGWINCDAFYRSGVEKEMLTLDCTPDKNTKFFALFSSVQGVMNMRPTSAGYSCDNIPATEEVTIVGFRVTDGKVEAYSHKGIAEDIKNIPVTFKPCKLKDLRRLLVTA